MSWEALMGLPVTGVPQLCLALQGWRDVTWLNIRVSDPEIQNTLSLSAPKMSLAI